MKKIIYISALIIVAIAVFIFWPHSSKDTDMNSATSTQKEKNYFPELVALPDENYKTVKIETPNGTITALLADTPEKEELGLGARQSLADNAGMLFIFDTASIYEFWMKGMKFPIDIIWISENKRVVGINPNISPDSYPETYTSPAPSKYVLEIPANASKKFNIIPGTLLKF